MYNGWIGVDLDGTLAEYHGWEGPDKIGPPVPLMVDRVKAWLDAGNSVRIMTARACKDEPSFEEFLPAWEAWSQEVFGRVLPVTDRKDYAMLELWDDRAIGVIRNTGRRADGKD